MTCLYITKQTCSATIRLINVSYNIPSKAMERKRKVFSDKKKLDSYGRVMMLSGNLKVFKVVKFWPSPVFFLTFLCLFFDICIITDMFSFSH